MIRNRLVIRCTAGACTRRQMRCATFRSDNQSHSTHTSINRLNAQITNSKHFIPSIAMSYQWWARTATIVTFNTFSKFNRTTRMTCHQHLALAQPSCHCTHLKWKTKTKKREPKSFYRQLREVPESQRRYFNRTQTLCRLVSVKSALVFPQSNKKKSVLSPVPTNWWM